jgi:prepilin-type N-terminal cleavage/methylation domain-containing protein
MFYQKPQKKISTRGFSIVELLIVLAVAGVLSAVVVTSAVASRQKARDERRLGDMREIQLALALYYDLNKSYPGGNIVSLGNALEAEKFIGNFPSDPAGGSYPQYEYRVTAGKYCLGVRLERTNAIPGDSSTCVSKQTGSMANYKVSR